MKISIWRQFSSNHSGHFEVIGEFESVEKAAQASEELKAILNEIREWWEGYFDDPSSHDWQAPEYDESPILTPVEEILRDKYEVDWQFSLNWYRWKNMWDYETPPIKQLEHVVVVYSPHLYLYKGPQPFDELLERFGAKVSVYTDVSITYPDSSILMDVECQLPDDELDAEIIVEGFREDFDQMHQPYDRSYVYNMDFYFDDDVYDMQFENNARVYEVEHHGNTLKLIGIRRLSDEGWSKGIVRFVKYLEKEGCTNISYTFRSALWTRKDDEVQP